MALIVDEKVLRNDRWAYIYYAALGFALAIEGSLIKMEVLTWPLNAVIYLVVMAATIENKPR